VYHPIQEKDMDAEHGRQLAEEHVRDHGVDSVLRQEPMHDFKVGSPAELAYEERLQELAGLDADKLWRDTGDPGA
jgi:hypothetical protein